MLAGRAGRLARLQRAKAQLEAEAAARQQRYQQRVAELAAAARTRGQRPGAHIRPRRRDEAPDPTATANTTDPDSRFVRGNRRSLRGYNAQAAATTEQVVVAAELTRQANDVQQLAPMLVAIATTVAAAGTGGPLQRLAADAGYWSIANVSAIPAAPELLILPARHGRHGKPRGDGRPTASTSDTLRAAVRARLDSTQGKADYAQRSRTIEPVFGQVKTVQGGWRVHATGAAGLPGRVEAAVWRPRPAQALAHDHGRHQLTGMRRPARYPPSRGSGRSSTLDATASSSDTFQPPTHDASVQRAPTDQDR